MGAGRWERSLPRAARLVSQSLDRLTTADGLSPCPHLFESWVVFFSPSPGARTWTLGKGKVAEYGA